LKKSDITLIEKWLYGLVAASISAGASTAAGVAASFVTGKPFDWGQVGTGSLVSAFIAAMFYLRQSPLPGYPKQGTTSIQIPASALNPKGDKNEGI